MHTHRAQVPRLVPPPAGVAPLASADAVQAWHHFTPYVAAPRPRSRWKLPAILVAAAAIGAGALLWGGREPEAKALRTEITDLRVSGPLPFEAASSLIGRQRDRLELCFTQAGVSGEAGVLSAKVSLGTDGLAKLVQVAPVKGRLTPAGSCIGRVLGSLYTAGGREISLEFTVSRK